MINASKDFDSALNFVTTESDPLTVRFSDKMDSSSFNAAFSEIESQINNLYEKIRLLEDIRDYTKEFVTRAIDERRNKILDNLKVIEALTDDIKEDDKIATVILAGNNEVIYDRDGTRISQLVRDNDLLIMPGKTLTSDIIKSVINKGTVNKISKVAQNELGEEYSATDYAPISSAEPFISYNLDITDKGTYCDVYKSSTPVEEGLIVQYEINLAGSVKCNYVNFNPVNCNILEVILYDPDGTPTNLDPKSRYFIPCRTEKALVKVKCSNYNKVSVAYPQKQQSDAFDKVMTGGEIYG